MPSMRSGLRFARAAYRAAVRPAGPDPMTMTLRTSPTSLGNVLVDHLLQDVLVGQTDHLLDDLAALEEQQRGDPAHGELRRRIGVLVDVHLAHDELAVVVACQLVHGRRQALAGTAPLRPEIDEHGL